MADKDDPTQKSPGKPEPGAVQQRRSRDFLIVKRGEPARPPSEAFAPRPATPSTPSSSPPTSSPPTSSPLTSSPLTSSPAAPGAGPWRSGDDMPTQRQAMAAPPAAPEGQIWPPPGMAPPAAPPPLTPAAPGADPVPTGPRHRLIYDGKVGELYTIFIINVLLSIVTLSIYRFWGKTRIRRYVWSHMSLMDERFEYAGTGKELFLGFLLALLCYAPVAGGLFYVQIQYPPISGGDVNWENVVLYYGATLVVLIVFAYLFSVAVYSTYRYRVSRTLWRGLRGSVGGSAFGYGARAFFSGILNNFCLGLLRPLIDTWLIKYRFNNTTIGSRRLDCTVDGGNLYVTFIICWIISGVAFVLAFFIYFVVLFASIGINRGTPDAAMIVIGVVVLIAGVIVGLLPMMWYHAAYLRATTNATRYENLRFVGDMTGGQFAWLTIGNTLIYIFTLSLGYPFVIQRTLRFICAHVEVIGEQSFDEISQTSQWRPRTGEGLGEFLGVGGI